MGFGEWFDLFLNKVRAMGYSGYVPKYLVEWEWKNKQDPAETAERFVALYLITTIT